VRASVSAAPFPDSWAIAAIADDRTGGFDQFGSCKPSFRFGTAAVAGGCLNVGQLLARYSEAGNDGFVGGLVTGRWFAGMSAIHIPVPETGEVEDGRLQTRGSVVPNVISNAVLPRDYGN
jgi:hypothetical protein